MLRRSVEDRGLSRACDKPAEHTSDSEAKNPESGAANGASAQDPNDIARFDAEELDASIRTRRQEGRGEVF